VCTLFRGKRPSYHSISVVRQRRLYLTFSFDLSPTFTQYAAGIEFAEKVKTPMTVEEWSLQMRALPLYSTSISVNISSKRFQVWSGNKLTYCPLNLRDDRLV
jgi:hypothetical protein